MSEEETQKFQDGLMFLSIFGVAALVMYYSFKEIIGKPSLGYFKSLLVIFSYFIVTNITVIIFDIYNIRTDMEGLATLLTWVYITIISIILVIINSVVFLSKRDKKVTSRKEILKTVIIGFGFIIMLILIIYLLENLTLIITQMI